jgi:hypothetical protein
MTPKEKAQQLLNTYHYDATLFYTLSMAESKKCALIATQEVIDTLYEYHYDSASGAYEFWTEVKEELEKL